MIITRTPFRVSFAGGGSDIEYYYSRFGGFVVSCSIKQYMYITMHPYFNGNDFLVKYSKVEHCQDIDDIQHPIIKIVLKKFGIKGCALNSIADIPSGTGLSSSSAFTVGLLKACSIWNNTYYSKEDLAEQSCDIEIKDLKNPIGKQDQYACACGGLNSLEFLPSGEVIVEKLYLPANCYKKLEENIMMFYTGKSRSASDILEAQKKEITKPQNNNDKILNLHKMVKLAKELKEELLKGNIEILGDILHQGWMYKKELSNKISNEQIDYYYDIAMKNGATGGKLLGAGGGGFLLFYCKKENQDRLRIALKDLKKIKFQFDNKGTTIVYYDR